MNSPDPYDSLHETIFTLFRVLTGEDWTDIRYNLIYASQLKLINVSKTTITLYHVSWVILSAFLLNLTLAHTMFPIIVFFSPYTVTSTTFPIS